ncbi:cell division cycle protein 23 homolog [Lineus longissimus]|uniref:cell division cycle protein 23 homolog n=1 Tax=Lineus longissimus TaxID=88925 RepID=UPI00315D11C1
MLLSFIQKFVSAELSFTLDEITPEIQEKKESDLFLKEYDRYTLAKSYFDLKEYDRGAYFLTDCKSSKGYFLHMYSRYMSGEKKKADDQGDSIGPVEKIENEHLRVLRAELYKELKETGLDGFCFYLYGVVLKKLDLHREALDALLEAVRKEPLHWGAWLELALLITDKEMLSSLNLPNHWMKQFFLGHIYLELQLNEEAFKVYQDLTECGFAKSTYIKSQIAVYYHNVRDVDQAVEAFTQLQPTDPCRLEHMDTFSNLLYVKEMRLELAHLALHCCEVDKYRVETCCVIGNYYSLRSQHDKAVLYFQRALKLNAHYLSAWTLMGHEYMEMKNSSAAIQAYRQAIEVNKRDYRAWYGLGQTYEILKMPYYCLYYYRQAQQLRPNDSRMTVALGATYEKLDRLQEAKKCFWKAHSIGDVEGTALIRLARLYDKLNEEEQAAVAYTEYINEAQRQGTFNAEELAQAYKYLANFHLKHERLNEAYAAATKCTEFNEMREEGKALLRQIASLRSLGEAGLPMEEDVGSITRERPHTLLDTPSASRLSPMNLTFD